MAGAQSTMVLLALGSGRRLRFVHRSGAACLQTLLWILCAAVCGAEQYFNVEVRAPGRAAPGALGSPLEPEPLGAGSEQCPRQPRPKLSSPGSR